MGLCNAQSISDIPGEWNLSFYSSSQTSQLKLVRKHGLVPNQFVGGWYFFKGFIFQVVERNFHGKKKS